MTPTPLVIAHRGASSHAPENTLAAIKMAIGGGAEGVEFDVQLARDGVPVVIHDTTLERTAFRSERISDLTSYELGKIDVGSWFNEKFPKRAVANFERQTIPTLAQVLQLLKAFRGFIYIELKSNKSNFRELANAVSDVVRDSPLMPQMILKSFRLAAIPEIRHRLPKVQTAALFGPTIMDLLRHKKHIVSVAREFGSDQLSVHYSLITRKLLSLAAADQMPVTIWTTDRPRWVRRCQRLGIAALITDDPAKLLKYREQSGI